MNMKIGLVQSHIAWEDKTKNIGRFIKTLEENKDRGLDCVFLPEMSFTGFSMNRNVTAERDGYTKKQMAELAVKYHLGIGFGWINDAGDTVENHYTVIGNTGEILSDYVKIHPFFPEQGIVTEGSRIPYFDINGIPFSLFICYDLRFPEIIRIAAQRSHVICLPANWPESRKEHWLTLLKARAIENQVYVLAINCVGEIGGLNYSGDSCVIDPDGKVRAMLSGAEGLLAYELTDDINEYRERFPVLKDSRRKLYADFYSGDRE